MIQCDDGGGERRDASGRRERRAGGVPCGWTIDGPSKFKRAIDGLPALLMWFGVGRPQQMVGLLVSVFCKQIGLSLYL